mmetsp:Transcript_48660/g.130241  ORF Transcript_48660/g.130241 Transcript_48660/m.130241 type:complete len:206 (+) Transcript_48660:546-1163(+)
MERRRRVPRALAPCPVRARCRGAEVRVRLGLRGPLRRAPAGGRPGRGSPRCSALVGGVRCSRGREQGCRAGRSFLCRSCDRGRASPARGGTPLFGRDSGSDSGRLAGQGCCRSGARLSRGRRPRGCALGRSASSHRLDGRRRARRPRDRRRARERRRGRHPQLDRRPPSCRRRLPCCGCGRRDGRHTPPRRSRGQRRHGLARADS